MRTIIFYSLLFIVCVDALEDILDSSVCSDTSCPDVDSAEAVTLLQKRAVIRQAQPATSAAAHLDGSSIVRAKVAGETQSSERPVPLTLLEGLGYKDALCMDGSSAGYYFRQASSPANSKRWILHLQGGAECVNEQECIARTFTNLGSSKNWSSSAYLGRYLLNETNPHFGSWNAVVFLYCSGDVWTGTQTASNTTLPGLQFSGHKIVEAIVDHLSRAFALGDAEEVILSGDSIGGAGVWITLDYIRDTLSSVPHIVGCPFAGYLFPQSQGILEYAGVGALSPYSPFSPETVKDYYKMWSSFVPKRCAEQLPESPWMCIFSNVAYNTLKTPLFLSQSQFDAVTMILHDGAPLSIWDCSYDPAQCPKDIVDFALIWQKAFFSQAEGILKNTRDGIFSPACLMHDAFLATEPLIDSTSAVEAFTSWYFDGTLATKFVDTCAGINCNPTCPQGPQVPNPVLGPDPA